MEAPSLMGMGLFVSKEVMTSEEPQKISIDQIHLFLACQSTFKNRMSI